jgi:hypothetical protein
MVGIAEEPPRQLAPSVGIAAIGFCHLGGIYLLHHQARHQQCGDYIWRIHLLQSNQSHHH